MFSMRFFFSMLIAIISISYCSTNATTNEEPQHSVELPKEPSLALIGQFITPLPNKRYLSLYFAGRNFDCKMPDGIFKGNDKKSKFRCEIPGVELKNYLLELALSSKQNGAKNRHVAAIFWPKKTKEFIPSEHYEFYAPIALSVRYGEIFNPLKPPLAMVDLRSIPLIESLQLLEKPGGAELVLLPGKRVTLMPHPNILYGRLEGSQQNRRHFARFAVPGRDFQTPLDRASSDFLNKRNEYNIDCKDMELWQALLELVPKKRLKQLQKYGGHWALLYYHIIDPKEDKQGKQNKKPPPVELIIEQEVSKDNFEPVLRANVTVFNLHEPIIMSIPDPHEGHEPQRRGRKHRHSHRNHQHNHGAGCCGKGKTAEKNPHGQHQQKGKTAKKSNSFENSPEGLSYSDHEGDDIDEDTGYEDLKKWREAYPPNDGKGKKLSKTPTAAQMSSPASPWHAEFVHGIKNKAKVHDNFAAGSVSPSSMANPTSPDESASSPWHAEFVLGLKNQGSKDAGVQHQSKAKGSSLSFHNSDKIHE